MKRSRCSALLLPLLACAAAAFDSRNISSEQWDCASATALSASFAASGGPVGDVGCGTEELTILRVQLEIRATVVQPQERTEAGAAFAADFCHLRSNCRLF